MKKGAAGLLAAALALCMSACSAGGDNPTDSSDGTTGILTGEISSGSAETEQGETDMTTDMTRPPDQEIPITEIGSIGVGVTCGDASMVTDELIGLLKKNNVTAYRLVFRYPFSDAEGKKIDPSFLKARAAAMKLDAAGITVIGQTFWPGGIGYDPATGKQEWLLHTGIPPQYADYESDLTYGKMTEATRYIAKSLGKYIEYWLVSNEPDIKTYTGPMTDEQIVRFVEACAKGIKEGNPNAKCGINLLGQVNKGRSLMLTKHLYRDGGLLDWIGLDGYFGSLQAGGPETWDAYITEFAEAAGTPVIITEWSYPSSETDPLGTFPHQWEGHRRGEQAQADYIKACMEVFSKHEEVLGTLWYQLTDSPPDAPCWECGKTECRLYSDWGLFRSDLSEKPAMAAMAEAAARFDGRR